MRKILIGFLLFVLLSSSLMFAAGQKEQEKISGGEVEAVDKPFKGIEIGVSLVANELVDTVIIPNLEAFEERTGMKVNIDAIAYGSLHEKQVLELAGKTKAYDVLLINTPWVQEYAKAGYLLPFDTFMDSNFESQYYKGLWDIGTINNKHYTIPCRLNAIGMVYWVKPFKEFGLAVPKTWEETLEVAKKLTQNDKYGMALPAKRGPAAVEIWMTLVGTAGGKIFHENLKPNFTSPESIESLKFWVDLTKYTPLGSNTWHWAEARAALSQGLATIHFGGITVIQSLSDPKVTSFPGEYATTGLPVPQKRLGQPAEGFSMFYNWVIAGHTNNPKAAWEFIKWITGPEMERIQGLTAEGRVPVDSARTDYYNDQEILEKRPVAGALREILEYSSPGPQMPEWPEITNELALRISEAVIGKKTPENALKEAQEFAESLLHSAGYF